MTLPDLVEERQEERNIVKQVAEEAVVEVVKQGVQEERVTCGADQCVEQLAKCPEDVMLCLLAQSKGSRNSAVTIKHVLLRAYCVENEIGLLSVDDDMKLKELVQSCEELKMEEDDTCLKPMMKGEEHCMKPNSVDACSEPKLEAGIVMRRPVQESKGRQVVEQDTVMSCRPTDEADRDQDTVISLPVGEAESTAGMLAQMESDYCSIKKAGSMTQPVVQGADLVRTPSVASGPIEKKRGAMKPAANGIDYGCIMITYPLHDTSEEENQVAKYIEQELRKNVEPVVTLQEIYQVPATKTECQYVKDMSSQAEDDLVQSKLHQPPPLSPATPASPPPDLGHWTLVRLKQGKRKTKAN